MKKQKQQETQPAKENLDGIFGEEEAAAAAPDAENLKESDDITDLEPYTSAEIFGESLVAFNGQVGEPEEAPKFQDGKYEVQPEILTRNCRVILTDAEIAEKNLEQNRLLDLIDEENEKFKELSASHKAVLKGLQNEFALNRNVIKNRLEWRQVECHEIFNYEEGKVSVVRTDTNELVESRPMKQSERQIKLFSETDIAVNGEEINPL